jgi:hypothetical protein
MDFLLIKIKFTVEIKANKIVQSKSKYNKNQQNRVKKINR